MSDLVDEELVMKQTGRIREPLGPRSRYALALSSGSLALITLLAPFRRRVALLSPFLHPIIPAFFSGWASIYFLTAFFGS